MSVRPFQPLGAETSTPTAQASVSITASAQALNLPSWTTQPVFARIFNDSTQSIAWAWGNATGLTLSNGVPMPQATVEVFPVPSGVTQISVIGGSATGTFRVVLGLGV